MAGSRPKADRIDFNNVEAMEDLIAKTLGDRPADDEGQAKARSKPPGTKPKGNQQGNKPKTVSLPIRVENRTIPHSPRMTTRKLSPGMMEPPGGCDRAAGSNRAASEVRAGTGGHDAAAGQPEEKPADVAQGGNDTTTPKADPVS